MTTTVPPPRLNAEALFDSVGPAYETAFATCTPQQASVDWLLTQLPSNATILDVGCGTGRPVCSSLAAAGHRVVGIDVSGAMITAAKENVPDARFEKVDIKDYVPEEGLDAVTVYFSMIASITQEEIRGYIAKMYSWLKKGGLFIFATVPISGEGMEIMWMGRPIVASSLGPEEVVGAIEKAGFEVLKSEKSKFTPKAVEAGICGGEDVWEEDHIFVYARK